MGYSPNGLARGHRIMHLSRGMNFIPVITAVSGLNAPDYTSASLQTGNWIAKSFQVRPFTFEI
jgi:hypothetical protein